MHHPVVTSVLLGIAVTLAITCSLGMAVMRDAYQRLHFSGPVATVCAFLIASAVWLEESSAQPRVKVVLIAGLLLLTNVLVMQAIAQATRRIGVFLIGAAGVPSLFFLVYRRLPGSEGFRSPYGEAIARRTVAERHVTDAVTSVNFDYRGIDTLGEEFILFVSVMGALVLLREVDEGRAGSRLDAISRSRAVRRPMPFAPGRSSWSGQQYSLEFTSWHTARSPPAAGSRAA